jgi:hypothetical protein
MEEQVLEASGDRLHALTEARTSADASLKADA